MSRTWLHDGRPWLGLPAPRSAWLRHKRQGGIVVVADVAEYLHGVETARPASPEVLAGLRDGWRAAARRVRLAALGLVERR